MVEADLHRGRDLRRVVVELADDGTLVGHRGDLPAVGALEVAFHERGHAVDDVRGEGGVGGNHRRFLVEGDLLVRRERLLQRLALLRAHERHGVGAAGVGQLLC